MIGGATNVATLVASLRADTGQFNRAMRGSQQSLSMFERAMKGGAIGSNAFQGSLGKLGQATNQYGQSVRGTTAMQERFAGGMRDLDGATGKMTRDIGGLGGEFGKLGGAMGQANSMTGQMTQGLGRLGTGLQMVSLAAVGAATGIATKFMMTGISMNSMLETTTLQFRTLMGSAEKAEEHVRGLFKFAAATPFETMPIIQASRLLQTFGGAALNTAETLTMVGDAAAAASTDIGRVGFYVGRAFAAIKGGRSPGEALMFLQEMAVVSAEGRTKIEALTKAGADWSTVWAVLETDLKRFSGAMDLQSKTWTGLMSTMSDLFSLNAADVFKPLYEGLKEVLVALIGLTETSAFKNFVAGARQSMGQLSAYLKPVAAGITAIADGSAAASATGVKLLNVISPMKDALSNLLVPLGLVTGFLAKDALVRMPFIGQFIQAIPVIGKVGAGMGSLVTIFIALAASTERGRAAFKSVATTLATVGAVVIPRLVNALSDVVAAAQDFIGELAALGAEVVQTIAPFVVLAGVIAGQILTGLAGLLRYLTPLIRALSESKVAVTLLASAFIAFKFSSWITGTSMLAGALQRLGGVAMAAGGGVRTAMGNMGAGMSLIGQGAGVMGKARNTMAVTGMAAKTMGSSIAGAAGNMVGAIGPQLLLTAAVTAGAYYFQKKAAAAAEAAAEVRSYTEALNASNGAIDGNIQKMMMQKLQDSKVGEGGRNSLTAAKRMGLDLDLLGKAASGNKAAIDGIGKSFDGWRKSLSSMDQSQLEQMARHLGVFNRQFKSLDNNSQRTAYLSDMLGNLEKDVYDVTGSVNTATKEYKQMAAAQKALEDSQFAAQLAKDSAQAALEVAALTDESARLQLVAQGLMAIDTVELVGKLGELMKAAISPAKAWADATTAAGEAVRTSLESKAASITKNMEAADASREAIDAALTSAGVSTDQIAEKVSKATASVKDFTKFLKDQLLATQTWSDNLITLQLQGYSGLAEMITDMGVEQGAGLLAQLVKATKEEKDELERVVGDTKLALDVQPLANQLAAFKVIMGKYGYESEEAFAKAIGKTVPDVRTILTTAGENAKTILAVMAAYAKSGGKATVDALTTELQAGPGVVARIMQEYGLGMLNGLNPILIGVGAKPILFAGGSGVATPGGGGRFADGGFIEQHKAQIARPGAMRIWAEPETGGEAYIPLARAKRNRSQSILGQVAAHFGLSLQPQSTKGVAAYAKGGTYNAGFLTAASVPLPPDMSAHGNVVGPTGTAAATYAYDAVVKYVNNNSMLAGGTPGAGNAGSGWNAIVSYLASQSVPYQVTSTTGGKHAKNSLHYAGKAVDLISGNMMQIFNALLPVAQNLKELFYTPAGFSIKNGVKVPPIAAAGHFSHVHAATYDQGGLLMPGLTMAYNGTGAPERVIGPNGEGSGSGGHVEMNITINQLPGESTTELVARLKDWVRLNGPLPVKTRA